jgi:DNA-directed RNA polymerase II subunit RPB3
MSAKITNLKEVNGKLTFTLSEVDVSYANALRRTLLSDIPVVVFKTSPHEENKSIISINTSRLHNEIVKQRLSCIPICITHLDEHFQQIHNYLLEIDVENQTDTTMVVTTADFKIRNKATNKYLDENTVKKIFPPFISPDGGEEYYIEFLRLKPKISEDMPGQQIKLTCEFSVGTARDDSMFNVTGTCSYGCTPNYPKIEEQLEIRKQKWRDEEKKEDEIKFESANWKLLEGMRYVVKNSFDFVLESVGIYDNEQLMIESCMILLQKMTLLKNTIDNNEIDIHPSDNTLDNCYDIVLKNEDYTVGNILNFELYDTFYKDLKVINYVGFKKFHPHDTDSLLRISLIDATKTITTIKTMLTASIDTAIKIFMQIKGQFRESA